LGGAPGAVSQWLTRARAGGVRSGWGRKRRRRTSPGAPPKLTPAQRAAVPALLAPGAAAYGFRGDAWTAPRIAWLLEAHFGVRYHPAHVTRLVRALGWTPQRPLQRVTQRDEAAVTRWWAERWLAGRALADPQEGARRRGRTLVWGDESGFSLLPGRVRTCAPRGQTPVLRVRLTRDHLSAIGAVTPDDRLPLHTRAHAFKGPDMVRFLQHLLRHPPGELLVRWDGAPIHHARPVKAFLAAGAAARLQLEQLPGYAPDLDPLDQSVWHHLKPVEPANVCCLDLPHLRREPHAGAERLRRRPHVIHGRTSMGLKGQVRSVRGLAPPFRASLPVCARPAPRTSAWLRFLSRPGS
jgi:transposase